MDEVKRKQIEAVNKFLFYGWNFPVVRHVFRNGYTTYVPKFIEEIDWDCDRDHMASKWMEVTSSKIPDAYLVRFYAELGGNARIQLVDYIVEHYNSERKLW